MKDKELIRELSGEIGLVLFTGKLEGHTARKKVCKLIENAIAQVRADEREAIAQFVEMSTTRQTKYNLAKAIRERGK